MTESSSGQSYEKKKFVWNKQWDYRIQSLESVCKLQCNLFPLLLPDAVSILSRSVQRAAAIGHASSGSHWPAGAASLLHFIGIQAVHSVWRAEESASATGAGCAPALHWLSVPPSPPFSCSLSQCCRDRERGALSKAQTWDQPTSFSPSFFLGPSHQGASSFLATLTIPNPLLFPPSTLVLRGSSEIPG